MKKAEQSYADKENIRRGIDTGVDDLYAQYDGAPEGSQEKKEAKNKIHKELRTLSKATKDSKNAEKDVLGLLKKQGKLSSTAAVAKHLKNKALYKRDKDNGNAI